VKTRLVEARSGSEGERGIAHPPEIGMNGNENVRLELAKAFIIAGTPLAEIEDCVRVLEAFVGAGRQGLVPVDADAYRNSEREKTEAARRRLNLTSRAGFDPQQESPRQTPPCGESRPQ
jgi:hypothetical protein